MSTGGLACLVKFDRVSVGLMTLRASKDECSALARRFAIEAVHDLVAEVELSPNGPEIDVRGRLRAAIDQRCALTDTPFRTTIDEPLAIRFVPALVIPAEEEEIEFDPDAPDEIEYSGAAIDLGEAVAQSLGLAIDPYAIDPEIDPETVRRDANLADETTPSGPFAALAALKKP